MNYFLEKAKQGGVLGTMLSELNSPNLPRIFRACGFDFLILDCEHGYFDYTSAANLIAVSRLCGLFPIVRIPLAGRENVQKYLDMGAAGLLLAMTETREQAEQLAALAKYPPQGKRGISLQRPHSDYCPGDTGAYLEKANRETVLFAQIESQTGVSNAAAIAGVPGIDGIIIGPNDLTLDLGCVGQYDHPDVVRIFRFLAGTAASCQKLCGLISSSLPLLERWKKEGFSLLSWNSEIGMLLNEGKRGVRLLKAAEGATVSIKGR